MGKLKYVEVEIYNLDAEVNYSINLYIFQPLE